MKNHRGQEELKCMLHFCKLSKFGSFIFIDVKYIHVTQFFIGVRSNKVCLNPSQLFTDLPFFTYFTALVSLLLILLHLPTYQLSSASCVHSCVWPTAFLAYSWFNNPRFLIPTFCSHYNHPRHIHPPSTTNHPPLLILMLTVTLLAYY